MTESAATTVAHPDELLERVGCELGTTGDVRLTQEAVDAFARITLDEQWIHVDPERAAAGPFGVPIVHGFLTLSLCSYFLGELIDVRGAGMVINYGLDRVRFPSPLAVGTAVRASGVLQSAERVRGGVQAVTRITISTDGAAKPTCVADQVSRYYASAESGGASR